MVLLKRSRLSAGCDTTKFPSLVAGKSHEWAYKPGSVSGIAAQSRRRSFIFARRLLAASIAIYPNVQRDGQPRDDRNESVASILFDLAPGGVYQAGRVTPTAGALLPHRFSLTTHRTST